MNSRITASLALAFCLALPGVILPARAQTPQPAGANCARTSVGFTPLSDMGTATYHGYAGGLYPGGANTPPKGYLAAGMKRARAIVPLNGAGKVAPNGSIVVLSIGMSNTTMEWSAFQRILPSTGLNPHLKVVDGAIGGQDSEIVADPTSRYWTGVAQRLQAAGVTPKQVQAVWLKEAIAGEHELFPQDAQHLQRDLSAIIRNLTQRFPHLQIVYLASRIYAGYAASPLNPEPYAYQSGFAVKWLIGDQIKSKAYSSAPWLAWGPYLWTDGTRGRKDGLLWECADVLSDGTHPSISGRLKVAHLLLRFFQTNPTAKGWFLAP